MPLSLARLVALVAEQRGITKAEFQRCWAPDAHFGCDVDELVLPLHALDVPLVMGHPDACSLLRDGRQTVDGIAAHPGYSGPANFSRAFRRWAGCTPSQYRDRCRRSPAA